jgi:hypothetical protein
MRALFLLTLLAASGCTAGRATYYLIDADRAYKDAVEAGAEEDAVYEFTLAWLYRDKAWEEWGYSDYQHSEELALKAVEFARAAEQVARYGAEERELIEDTLEEVPDEILRVQEGTEEEEVQDTGFSFEEDE